ncbi:MAG: hypothetical protein M3R18_01455, partial [Pseudomonadota bacterium]|nr:hypothetical protein [Pseudomonadota bacterium]
MIAAPVAPECEIDRAEADRPQHDEQKTMGVGVIDEREGRETRVAGRDAHDLDLQQQQDRPDQVDPHRGEEERPETDTRRRRLGGKRHRMMPDEHGRVFCRSAWRQNHHDLPA